MVLIDAIGFFVPVMGGEGRGGEGRRSAHVGEVVIRDEGPCMEGWRRQLLSSRAERRLEL